MRATASVLDGVRLLARHGGVVEVRILGTRKGTVSGYFDDLDALARAVEPWDGQANIYVTANPVNRALLARATNRLREFVRETTADRDILRRVWLLIDCDPVRPKGISATGEELAAALARRNEVVAFLQELGFPALFLAMSGNGGHAGCAVDLPNDDETTRLIERALKALGARFTDERVLVDESVFNAARIWKLYGTMAVKGDATPERPHRRAALETVPDEVQLLARDGLERLAAMAHAATTVSAPGPRQIRGAPFDLVGAFQARGWYKRALGGGKHAVVCPWASEHSGDSGVTESCLFAPKVAGEPWGFDCKHAHCAHRTIRDVVVVLGLTGRNGPEEASPAVRTEWPLYDAADEWDFPPSEFAVEGLLPLFGTVWLGGLPKRFKSLLALYLCLAIASGRVTVAGRFAIRARPKLLYVAREDPGARLAARIADILSAWGGARPPHGALRFMIRPHLDLLDPAHVAWLRETCQRESITLLVLDTWTALAPSADPLGARDQATLAAIVVQLAQDIGGVVIILDHSRKNRPDGQPLTAADILGPSQKWQAAEHVLMLDATATPGRIEVFIEGKDAEGPTRFFLTVSPPGSGAEKFTYAGSVEEVAEAQRAVGDQNRENVYQAARGAGGPVGLSEILDTLDSRGIPLARRTAQRHLDALVRARRLATTGTGRRTRYAWAIESRQEPSPPISPGRQEDRYADRT